MKMYRPHRLCPRNSKPKEPRLYRSLCVSILCMFLSTVMLVGTTFAWFYSSATSAVSTITAGGLNVSTSYITKNTALAHRTESTGNSETTGPVYTYDDISTLGWVNFDGNGGNPFGSIPFTESGTSQIVFLKVENKSNSHATYRLSLNLLGDASSAQPESNLYYGYQVLGSSVSTESLCKFTIPGSNDSNFKPNDLLETTVTDTNYSSTTEKVTTEGPFYGDALSAHGISSTDSNTFGGNLCVVDLPKDSIKYIAVALYMRAPSSETVPPTSSFLVQLSMTVNQFGAANPLMPNVVGSTAVTQQDLESALSVMYEGFLNEDEPLVVDETKLPEDDSVTNAETPAETGDATVQPPTDTEKIPVPPETPSGSTGEAGTSESGDTGDTGTDTGTPAAGSESEPAPTPAA